MIGFLVFAAVLVAYGATGVAVAVPTYFLQTRRRLHYDLRTTSTDMAIWAGSLWPIFIWWLIAMRLIERHEHRLIEHLQADREREEALEHARALLRREGIIP